MWVMVSMAVLGIFLLCGQPDPIYRAGLSMIRKQSPLPTVIYPDILAQLRSLGYDVKLVKVLFLTDLNSIKMSIESSDRNVRT